MTEPRDETVALSYASGVDPRAALWCLRSLRWFVLGIGALVISVPCISLGIELGAREESYWPECVLAFGLVCLLGALAGNTVSMVFGYVAWITYKEIRWWVILSTVVWLPLMLLLLGLCLLLLVRIAI